MPHVIKNTENLIQEKKRPLGQANKEWQGGQKKESQRRKYKAMVCAHTGLSGVVADQGQKERFIPVMIRRTFPVGPGPRFHSRALCMKEAPIDVTCL